MEYEDGEETKSDFLARMILMGRVDIDEQNKTLKSNITCKEENPEASLPVKVPTKPKPVQNPIVGCDDGNKDCSKYNVIAKGFFSSYTQTIEQGVLEGAKNLIFEAAKCEDVNLKADGDSVKNEANFMMDEWHHKYDVNFTVSASDDPKPFLAKYFDENIKQLGEAAVKIGYVETVPLDK